MKTKNLLLFKKLLLLSMSCIIFVVQFFNVAPLVYSPIDNQQTECLVILIYEIFLFNQKHNYGCMQIYPSIICPFIHSSIYFIRISTDSVKKYFVSTAVFMKCFFFSFCKLQKYKKMCLLIGLHCHLHIIMDGCGNGNAII